MSTGSQFLCAMPKAELHMHLDGALSPALMLELAERNRVKLPYETLEQVEAAYQFTSLQSFLDLLYQGASVLRDERDYYDLTYRYLLRCRQENVLHTEPSFDPQTHTERGIPFETVLEGTRAAMRDAGREWGQSSLLVMDFLRHLSAESAMRTLEAALPYRDEIVAVGLDSSELGNPPSKFSDVFARARAQGVQGGGARGGGGAAGLRVGGDPPARRAARRSRRALRRSVEDPVLVRYLREQQLPLTVCPLSNVRLGVFESLADHDVLRLLEEGLCVTINSDDPEYFGGYVNANYLALAEQLDMSTEQALRLAQNGFRASVLSEAEKARFQQQLSAFAREHPDLS